MWRYERFGGFVVLNCVEELISFVKSYGTRYSHFLLDYMLVPRLSIPITFFFVNEERSAE